MTQMTSPPSSAGSISCLDYKKVIGCLGLIITRLQGVGESCLQSLITVSAVHTTTDPLSSKLGCEETFFFLLPNIIPNDERRVPHIICYLKGTSTVNDKPIQARF